MATPAGASDGRSEGPATYRIRVAGALDEDWIQRMVQMSATVSRTESGGCITEMLGALPDTAALMGVLDLLYTRGARLLSVEHLASESEGPCPGLEPRESDPTDTGEGG